MPTPVSELLDRHSVEEIDGIGESIEIELQALRTTGSSPRHQELLSRLGPGVLDLMQVNGLGTRRLQVLYQDAGISSIDALKRALDEGTLHRLRHFGEGVAERLATEIAHWERTRGKRYPLSEARGLAESIRLQLLELPEVDRAEVAGSIRRGKETIGDIDILVTTKHPASVARFFKTLPEVIEILNDGDTRASVRVFGGIQVDLRVLEPSEFGAGLHYFTGNKDHHIKMRLRAKKLGLKISEHGVVRYDDPDEVPVAPMESEEQVFAAVGLPYIPPEIRMGKGEIEAAENGQLPDLVDVTSLRGDVHTLSSADETSLDAVVYRARQLGYEWLVVAQRSPALCEHHAPTIDALRRQLERVREYDARLDDFRLLPGIVVEISPDGLLDFDHRLLVEYDWVLGTVATELDPDPAVNTQRVVWGIETGLLSCLSRPTGRRVGRHDGHELYLDEIVDCCIDFRVALEMSGDPACLDLNAATAARVHARGAMLALGSCAGSAAAMSNIEYAVQQARRGWLEKKDVLNTLTADELLGSVRSLIRR